MTSNKITAVFLFSYYAKRIPHYSEKIRPLVVLTKFPLNDDALHALTTLKTDLSSATHGVIDEDLPFILETDSSDNVISATLNQQGDRPVAFFSRMFNKCELHYSSVERDALAIIKAVRKWTHFLTGRHFTVVMDQRPVSFMYSGENRGKIKNEKLFLWRMELNELILTLFIALESLTLLQMRLLEFTALACVGLHFMISMPRCVTRVSHICIALFVRKIYRFLLKTFAKQFAIVAYIQSSNQIFINPLLLNSSKLPSPSSD